MIRVLELIQLETSKSRVLSDLMTVIRNGWPEHKRELADELVAWWSVRHDLATFDDLVFMKDRMVVPKGKARTKILDCLHVGHPGIVKMHLKAVDYFYWPKMRLDIENKVANCEACQQNQRSQQPEPLKCDKMPEHPFEVCGADIFKYSGHHYLVIADTYSKWLEVLELKTFSCRETIEHLQNFIAAHGCPRKFISDGGPQFSSYLFDEFCEEFDIKHRKSSPTYPQSNGFAERNVQTAKNMLRKCTSSKDNLSKALLHHRNTPISSGLPSPAELACGRKLRCDLPAPVEKYVPHRVEVRALEEAFVA